MTSKTIKDFLKKHGLKTVRVSSSKHYISAMIPNNCKSSRDPLTWPEEFPLELRVKCLEIIYPGAEFNKNGNAGNVDGHRIAMHREQWEKAME